MTTFTNYMTAKPLTLNEKLAQCNKQIANFVKMTKKRMSHDEKVALVAAWDSVTAYKLTILNDIVALQKFIESSKN